jgi:hypothetical protein
MYNRGLIALFLLQCNIVQKDSKGLRIKSELLEQELRQTKEKTASVTKVKYIAFSLN